MINRCRCIVVLLIMLCTGCLRQTDTTGVSPASVASCDECHTFPGSAACSNQTYQIKAMERTTCFECHGTSIVVDSTPQDSSFIYYDAMNGISGAAGIPVTDTGHTNGRFDLAYNQCIRCHTYPPYYERDVVDTAAHFRHVSIAGKKCFECHSRTIVSETVTGSSGTDVYTYRDQKMKIAHGGTEIPVVDNLWHRNKHVNVSFLNKDEGSGTPGNDTMYIWDPVGKSCSNVGCHGEPGDAGFHQTFWRKGL